MHGLGSVRQLYHQRGSPALAMSLCHAQPPLLLYLKASWSLFLILLDGVGICQTMLDDIVERVLRDGAHASPTTTIPGVQHAPTSKTLHDRFRCGPSNSCPCGTRDCRYLEGTAKAILVLLTIPPWSVLWNFTTRHDPAFRLHAAGLPRWPTCDCILPRVILSTPTQFRAIGLTSPQVTPTVTWQSPGSTAFFAAVISVVTLLTVYSKIGTSVRGRSYLVYSFMVLCPVFGFILGLGWLPCLLILLPLHITSGLVCSDVYVWLGCYGRARYMNSAFLADVIVDYTEGERSTSLSTTQSHGSMTQLALHAASVEPYEFCSQGGSFDTRNDGIRHPERPMFKT